LHAARADINARLKARSHYDDDVVIEHVDTHTHCVAVRRRTARYDNAIVPIDNNGK